MESPDEFFMSRNFQNYRGSNDNNYSHEIISKDEKRISFSKDCLNSTAGDSAYNSYCFSTSSNFSNISSSRFSSNSSVTQSALSISSLNYTKSSNQQQINNLEAIHEHSKTNSDFLTLTPVTQNAQRISAFHITTPKNEQNQDNQIYVNKRSLNFSFEDYQSTPKKFKNCQYDIYSTPQKHKSNKKMRQRLHSAPDYENLIVDKIGIWQTPKKFITVTTPKRTPLQSMQQINQTSTPIKSNIKFASLAKRKLVDTTLNNVNEFSIEGLVKCSNDEFDSILNTDWVKTRKETKAGCTRKVHNDENQFHKSICPTEVNKNNCKTFRRFLKFNTQNSSSTILKDICTSKPDSGETNLNNFESRRSYPSIHSVIHDRLKAKNRANAERTAILNKQNSTEILQDCKKEINLDNLDSLKGKKCEKIKKNILTKIQHVNVELSPKQIVCKSEYNIQSKTNKCLSMDISPVNSQKFLSENTQHIEMELSPLSVNLYVKMQSQTLINDKNSSVEIDIEPKENIELDDFLPLTPPSILPDKLLLEDDKGVILKKNLIWDFTNLEHNTSLPTTPPRKTSRSSSISSQKSSISEIKKEKFLILYPTIPETPKKCIKFSPKKSPKKNKKVIANKFEQTNRIFYDGVTYLNIIAKLEPYTIVLQNIFKFLADIDLLNLSMTTKVYRTIIQENYQANLRLIKFVREYKINKENNIKQYQVKDKKKSDSLYKNVKVKPFSLHNDKLLCKRDSHNELKQKNNAPKSPTVSPLKRKFNDYQKIIQNLTEKQSMGKCPRCSTASRVVNQAPLDSFSEISSITDCKREFDSFNNNSKKSNDEMFIERDINLNSNKASLEIEHYSKNLSYFQPSLDQQSITDLRRSSLIAQRVTQNSNVKGKLSKAFSVDSWQGQLRKQRLLHEISTFQPYGECTSLRCKFQYCLECFCDYHPQQKCKLTASVSPSKEDMQNGILLIMESPKKSGYRSGSASGSGTRSINMKRKSLKRLCFN